MSCMVVHTELNKCVECLLQSSLSGLITIAQWVRHGVLNRSLIISRREVWMTSPPRVIGVCIRIKTLPGLIGIHIIYCSGSYKLCGHILALWPNTPQIPKTSLFCWARLFRRVIHIVSSVICATIPLFTCTSLTKPLLPLVLFCWA